MKILDIRWFCGRSTVGVVRIQDEYDGIKYYIGTGEGHYEEADKQNIADWGSTFPTDAGDILFGVK
jgi:hypothetical protein